MSAVAVCNRTSAFESILVQSNNKDLESGFQKLISSIPMPLPRPRPKEDEFPPGQFDVWSSIQAQKKPKQSEDHTYVHPLMRRSSSLLSQKSLEICTESLGSETGSDDYFSSDDENDFFSGPTRKEQQQQMRQTEACKKQRTTVNYHCSIGRRSSLPRSFPPPLPSLSRRDGPCLQMRPHRRDGRLVVEAVSIPSQNYLHAERQNGHLLLSFVNSAAATASSAEAAKAEEQEQEQEIEHEEEAEAEEEEEEQVEVVDRGTIVEVKVSTQPQQNSTIKVHRSSIVINKFVSCMPVVTNDINENNYQAPPTTMKSTTNAKTTTTTAAAAAVAASSVSTTSAYEGGHSSLTDNKMLFTSKRSNREELLRDMRRCSELRKPLFIWEPCCIATSS